MNQNVLVQKLNKIIQPVDYQSSSSTAFDMIQRIASMIYGHVTKQSYDRNDIGARIINHK